MCMVSCYTCCIQEYCLQYKKKLAEKNSYVYSFTSKNDDFPFTLLVDIALEFLFIYLFYK